MDALAIAGIVVVAWVLVIGLALAMVSAARHADEVEATSLRRVRRLLSRRARSRSQ